MLIKLKAGVWVNADEIAVIRVNQIALQHGVEFLLRGPGGATVRAECDTEAKAAEIADEVATAINRRSA